MTKVYDFIKTYLLYMIVLISIILVVTITYFLQNTKKVVAKVEEKVIEEKEKKEDVYFKVDIKGAITTPGVYSLKEDSRVIDVINLAGGVLENANTNLINLSKKISDEMVIIIYTNDELKEYNEGKVKTEYVYIEVNQCPDALNNACITPKTTETSETTTIVNINTATTKELETLTGIGESKAIAIIDYREKNGKFTTIEDLKNVTGIGNSIFEKIKDHITV